MASFSKPSSLICLHQETPPRTPERSSASSIVVPSAPKKPRRPSALNRIHLPVFASTAMELAPILETQTHELSSSDEASHHTTNSSSNRRRDDSDDDDGQSKASRSTTTSRPYRYATTIERILTIEAPEVFLDDDLTLLSYGASSLVIALDDQLFLCPKDSQQIEMFTCTQDGKPISCVQWSPRIGQTDKSLLAIGLETSVQVWSVETGCTLLAFHGHSGYVTSIGWKPDGTEMLAASSDAGIYRYNMLAADPTSPIHYSGGEASTCLRWTANKQLIAGAGNGLIQLWDAKQKGEGIRTILTLPHTGVRCLEFCPDNDRNLLASGGDGGIHFWNLDSGLLRGSISTDAPVTAIVWSRGDEIIVAHGVKLSIWKIETMQPTKIGQVETGGKILSMDQGLDGRIACLQENETCNVFQIVGDSNTAHECSGSMDHLTHETAVI